MAAMPAMSSTSPAVDMYASRPTKLFVGGISRRTTTKQLRDHFSKYGRVLDCVAMRQPDGRPRGFGYVTLESPEAAELFLREPQLLDERIVDVKPAVPDAVEKGQAPVHGLSCDFGSLGAEAQQLLLEPRQLHMMWPGGMLGSEAIGAIGLAGSFAPGVGYMPAMDPAWLAASWPWQDTEDAYVGHAAAVAMHAAGVQASLAQQASLAYAAAAAQVAAAACAAPALATTAAAAAAPSGLSLMATAPPRAAAATAAPPPGLQPAGVCESAVPPRLPAPAKVAASPLPAGPVAASPSPAAAETRSADVAVEKSKSTAVPLSLLSLPSPNRRRQAAPAPNNAPAAATSSEASTTKAPEALASALRATTVPASEEVVVVASAAAERQEKAEAEESVSAKVFVPSEAEAATEEEHAAPPGLRAPPGLWSSAPPTAANSFLATSPSTSFLATSPPNAFSLLSTSPPSLHWLTSPTAAQLAPQKVTPSSALDAAAAAATTPQRVESPVPAVPAPAAAFVASVGAKETREFATQTEDVEGKCACCGR